MRELRVLLRFDDGDVREVGTLVEDGRRVWFAYADGFAGPEISPIRLPHTGARLVEHRVRAGVPLPGVFNDARPDGWGLLLLHRAFQARGRATTSVSALDELAALGHRTMGALVFEPCDGDELADAVDLAALAAHAQAVWEDRVHDVLPGLVRAGGPSGGARPKALIGLPEDGGPGFRYGEGELPAGWGAWLVKFPTRTDDVDVGRREAAWSAMAARAGIVVPEARVLPLAGVGDAFAVRRFDRPGGGRRVHVLSGAGALDVDFRAAGADYEHLLRATLAICHDLSEVEVMFRRAVFNVVAVNEDDHLRNVAWRCGADGVWRVAPGFDLTYAPRAYGERWTTVAGVGREVGRDALARLAKVAGLKATAARRIVDEVTTATAGVRSLLSAFGCDDPVSRAAADAVTQATARVASAR